MDFPAPPDLRVEPSPDSRFARQLRHSQAPFVGAPGASARHVALAYLTAARDYYPLTGAELEFLRETIDGGGHQALEEGREPPRFRWHEDHEIRGGESNVVSIEQFLWLGGGAATVWRSGLRVMLQRRTIDRENRWLVTSSSARYVPDVRLPRHDGAAAASASAGGRGSLLSLLARLLSVDPDYFIEPNLRFLVYRVDLRDRRDPLLGFPLAGRPPPPGEEGDEGSGGDRIVVGGEFMVDAAGIGQGSSDRMGYRVFVDVAGEGILYSRALVSACTGQVFSADPITRTGDLDRVPASHESSLDALRETAALERLDPPAGDATKGLHGALVSIQSPNLLDFDPPRKAAPYDFHYGTRSNDFAAVNAYHQCDAMFGLVAAFGFDLSTEFASSQFPVQVIHRAPIVPGACHDGRCINAQVVQGGPNRIESFRFALGDLTDTWASPLGLTADVRWIWHEFCHALLVAGTGRLEFDFAHSAGDALGAIMLDPDSRLATDPGIDPGWRGVTFPWVWQPLRRHDRAVELGWSWDGTLYDPARYPDTRDPAGYVAEQILSSSLFRLYRAIGGDALATGLPDPAKRRFAADFVVYLIIRAIFSLRSVPADASAFATALMDADIGTTGFTRHGETLLGGTAHKIVRWAFEQQGLYQAAGAERPRNRPGEPELVDVFLDDAAHRRGGYAHTTAWQADSDTLWSRPTADGKPEGTERTIEADASRFVYVRAENRGAETAHAASVEVLAAADDAIAVWDASRWIQLPAARGATTTADIRPGLSEVFGPFVWKPAAGGRHALLARASAPGDRSNIDAGSNLPCAPGPVPVGDLVPRDNNLGYRSWIIR